MSPSSRFLAKKMLDPIDFGKAKIIVELGPGTGVFTRRMLELMSADAVLLVFELNDNFMNMLKKEFKDPRVHLIHDSAENIGEYVREMGFSTVDAVVSSLPLANFPDDLRNRILRESHTIMDDHSIYVQFQYSLMSKNAIKELFPKVDISFTAVNFPPAFVYTCRK